jgi:azurin
MRKLLLPAFLAVAAVFAFAQDPKPAAPAGDAVELTLGVIPNVMQYDKKELTVKAGAKVKLTFKNEKCVLQHNFLLLKPGTKDAVGNLSDKMLTTDPAGAMTKQYVPDTADILVKGNKLIGIAQSDVIEFTAPAEAGDYPYICTFPGHWRLMHGVLKVTK